LYAVENYPWSNASLRLLFLTLLGIDAEITQANGAAMVISIPAFPHHGRRPFSEQQ
jgi:hypothetical protein